MQVPAFEDLSVTTMTLIIGLSQPINIPLVFHLLPVTRIEIEQTRNASKCKLPHCEIPGSILSLRHVTNVRGIIRTVKRPFKNAITVDMSIKSKNVNFKLSPETLQLCGAKSIDDGVESANHIISHLRHAQSVVDRINENPELARSTTEWIKNITRGPLITREIQTPLALGGREVTLHKTLMTPSITRPDASIPEDCDIEIARFMFSMIDDFKYHEDMCKKLDFILTLDQVLPENIEISFVNQAMVNYNYYLGFRVDRMALNELINGRDGFMSRFNHEMAHAVTIEMPYESPQGSNTKRRKNKVPHHSFMVYTSGAVTQSGPGPELMRDVYYKFMKCIHDLKDHIIYHEEPIKLEY